MNTNTESKYYLVTAMCGHIGRLKYIPINFAVYASSTKDASKLVRGFPRVKKQRKDAIISCVEISYEQYLIQLNINRNSSYLAAKRRKDVDMDDEFIKSIHHIEKRAEKERRPLSRKYRTWKAEGRYVEKMQYEGEWL